MTDMSFASWTAAAVTLCIATLWPSLIGAQVPGAVFEVASVRAAPGADPNTGTWSPPNTGSFNATHVSMDRLLQLAYGVDASQILGKPAWLETRLYDITAKPEQGVTLTRDELKPRLQALLATRFGLRTHSVLLPTNGFSLLLGDAKPTLKPTNGEHFSGFRVNVSTGHMHGYNWSMPAPATYLASALHRPVVDLTGIAGSYDIDFDYATADSDLDVDAHSIATALKASTNLVLKAGKVPVLNLVIDSVSVDPTEN